MRITTIIKKIIIKRVLSVSLMVNRSWKEGAVALGRKYSQPPI